MACYSHSLFHTWYLLISSTRTLKEAHIAHAHVEHEAERPLSFLSRFPDLRIVVLSLSFSHRLLFFLLIDLLFLTSYFSPSHPISHLISPPSPSRFTTLLTSTSNVSLGSHSNSKKTCPSYTSLPLPHFILSSVYLSLAVACIISTTYAIVFVVMGLLVPQGSFKPCISASQGGKENPFPGRSHYSCLTVLAVVLFYVSEGDYIMRLSGSFQCFLVQSGYHPYIHEFVSFQSFNSCLIPNFLRLFRQGDNLTHTCICLLPSYLCHSY